MFLLGAMAIGALVGAVAGTAVYGVKTAISKEKTWSWKAAAAHAAGGFVGGGLFPAVFAGLAAAGLPVAGAYVLAGGLAWGGVWTLAQDATSWALGLKKGMGGPGKYLVATGVGILATALLFPIAGKVIGSTGLTNGATVKSLITPAVRHVPASLAKSEAEFLAFGAMAEVAERGIARAGNELADALAERMAAKQKAKRSSWARANADRIQAARRSRLKRLWAARKARAERARAAQAATRQKALAPSGAEPLSPFGSFLPRTQTAPGPVSPPLRIGLRQQLQVIGPPALGGN